VPPVRVAIEAGRARIVATKSDKPTQPSPEEGARQAAPGGPCVRHNGIAAGRACAAPPVACRDRGGRRQWHVGIAAGAAGGMSGSRRAPPDWRHRQRHVGIAAGSASGMSGSRRAPPVACRKLTRNRGAVSECRSSFVRTRVATRYVPFGPLVRSVAIAADEQALLESVGLPGLASHHSVFEPEVHWTQGQRVVSYVIRSSILWIRGISNGHSPIPL
jgi:hypothetical protein